MVVFDLVYALETFEKSMVAYTLPFLFEIYEYKDLECI